VLIPRPETEELGEWIITEAKTKKQPVAIIDIGTGSGCIAIALKKELVSAEIFGIDISADALSVARQNSSQLGADIKFLQCDFLDETSWQNLTSFDIIVSNPPYISENEKQDMKRNVIQYEPHAALFTGAADHLIFYKKIALFAKSNLNKEGEIYAEVNDKYANEVNQVFNQHGFSSTIKKDVYGRDRMIKAYL
jgi:release factor glutamine methyltransferase